MRRNGTHAMRPARIAVDPGADRSPLSKSCAFDQWIGSVALSELSSLTPVLFPDCRPSGPRTYGASSSACPLGCIAISSGVRCAREASRWRRKSWDARSQTTSMAAEMRARHHQLLVTSSYVGHAAPCTPVGRDLSLRARGISSPVAVLEPRARSQACPAARGWGVVGGAAARVEARGRATRAKRARGAGGPSARGAVRRDRR